MSDQELIEQFERCQIWQDPQQWELLALVYLARGYLINARRCFELADACAVTAETVPA